MASVANIVRFLPASGSTGDFVYSSGVTGYRTPVSSPALTDGATYRYRAESADLSEWEVGEGTWTTATTTLARTTIIHSSTGAKVNFTVAPNVAIVALADQFVNPAGDTMTGSLVVPNASGIKIKDTDASHTLGLVGGSNLTADRTLTLTTGDANRTLDISAGSVTVSTAGAALIDDADAAEQLVTLGLGTPTGTGGVVRATSPTLVTPVLGAATATTIDAPNKGNRFGTASGANVRTAPAVTDANIQLYQTSSTNWAGFVVDSSGAFGIRTGLSGTPDCAFNILTDGNVGIGTTSPGAKLHVEGSIFVNSNPIYFIGGPSDPNYLITGDMWDTGMQYKHYTAHKFYTGGSERVRIASNGNVGIGTTSPSAMLHNTTSTRHSHLGSGAVQSDASGNLSVSSDERLKFVDADFTRGMEAISAIQPILYRWRPESGMDQCNTYCGFSAQNVESTVPEAIGEDARGFLTLNDRALLATAINAINQLHVRLMALEAK